jgi:predicted nucleic acid-binding protein
MPYLVDSNVVIDHLEDIPSAAAILESLTPKGLAISIVTYMEAFQGVERSPELAQARGKFQAFTDGVLILPFSFAVAERCARLRETLRTQKKRVNSRALDLMYLISRGSWQLSGSSLIPRCAKEVDQRFQH